ncbi:MAG: hypothetical protein QM766_09455 [Burkholderiaceae bacterium]
MIVESSPIAPSLAVGTSRASMMPPSAGTSWGAIFAGAVAAAALSLILFTLGAGLGLSAVSPWRGQGLQAGTVGIAAIAWLMLTQLAASGVGGYLAGRLRTRWHSLHEHEVYFRDTAHGFVAWGIATLAVVVILSMAVGGVVRTGVESGARVAGGVAQGAVAAAGAGAAGIAAQADAGGSRLDPVEIATDALFRPEGEPLAGRDDEGRARAEAARLFAAGVAKGRLADDDRQYLARQVAAMTGLTPAQAAQRVSQRFDEAVAAVETAKQLAAEAADTARRATMRASLWSFAALLVGAFVASLAATWGGRRRDRLDPIFE